MAKKENKTNAMRILDRNKIAYRTRTYECDEFIDGIHVADINGDPYDQSFKTLVTVGKTGAYYVFVIPIDKEIDSCEATSQVRAGSHLATAARVTYPAALQRIVLDAPLPAAGLLT